MTGAGASDEAVRLTPYDPAWPAAFERERVALEASIGPWVVGGIHHVGSTAVPGLEAKPIVDILAGVEDLEDSRECFEPLAALEYLYAPYRSDEMHWFCKPRPERRTHHLHLVPVGSRRYVEELAFRDLLRADPKVAAFKISSQPLVGFALTEEQNPGVVRSSNTPVALGTLSA